MTVPNEHQQPSVSCGKIGTNQDIVRSNGFELDEGDDDSDGNECKGKLSKDCSGYRRKRLRKVSEAWQSTIINQNIRLAKLSDERSRPSLSLKRLKAESSIIFATEMALVSDKEVYNTIENILFLMNEARLYKNIIHADYTNLKKIFERDEATVRNILTQANIPSAITESLLDTHIKSSASFSAKSMVSPTVPSNTTEVAVENPISTSLTTQDQHPSIVPSPLNTNVPPPIVPRLLKAPSIPLPDVTKPPPTISNIGVMVQPQTVGSGSSCVPPPPVNLVLPPPCSTIPPGFSNITPPGSNIPSGYSSLPPPFPQKTPVATILQATLKPYPTSQYSGPFGPPIGLRNRKSSSTSSNIHRPLRISPHNGNVKRHHEVV